MILLTLTRRSGRFSRVVVVLHMELVLLLLLSVQLDVGDDVFSPWLDVEPHHAASLPPPVLQLGLAVVGWSVVDVLHHHPHLGLCGGDDGLQSD